MEYIHETISQGSKMFLLFLLIYAGCFISIKVFQHTLYG